MTNLAYKQLPIKAGKLVKNKNDDNTILINENGKAFSTNFLIIDIWKLCDGSLSAEEIISHAHIKYKEVNKNEILSIIEKLIKTDLVKLF